MSNFTTRKLLFSGVIIIAWTVLWAFLAKSEMMQSIGLCVVGVSVFVYAAYIVRSHVKRESVFTRCFYIANIAFLVMFFALFLYYCLTFTI